MSSDIVLPYGAGIYDCTKSKSSDNKLFFQRLDRCFARRRWNTQLCDLGEASVSSSLCLLDWSTELIKTTACWKKQPNRSSMYLEGERELHPNSMQNFQVVSKSLTTWRSPYQNNDQTCCQRLSVPPYEFT